MSNPTTPFSWQMPTAVDLVTDLPADFEVFGQAVATSMADLLGGTTGQVLAKTSATDMDFTWTTPQVGDITGVTAGVGISGGGTSGTVTVTNDMATTITTAGDLIYGTGSGTYTRRGIGSTGNVLTVSGGVPVWSAPAGGGKVLQVVYGSTSTGTTVASTTFTDSTLTATITPTLNTSKILIMTAQPIMTNRNFEKAGSKVRLMRDATAVFTQGNTPDNGGSSAIQVSGVVTTTGYVYILSVNNIMYLDSPATTSATTYKTQIAVQDTANSGSMKAQANDSTSTIILMEIGA